MNYRIVAYFIGTVLKVEGACMLLPMAVSLIGGEGYWYWFLVSAAFSVLAGFLLSQKEFRNGRFFAREGYVATGLSWVIFSMVGALPFVFSGTIPDYIDALFETASGFTTTGASILHEVEVLGKGMLFWRSFMHFLGGMGILVFILAILPLNSGYYMQFMKAESPGPSVSKLLPRVGETAKALYMIYILMTTACILTYWISGMPFFDAVCIGMGTAGTGGFSVRNSGMGGYSALSQVLIGVWMLLFGVNFNVYYLAVRRRFRDALKSEEVRVYWIIVLVAVVLLTLNAFFGCYLPLLRESGAAVRASDEEHLFFYTLRNAFFMTSSLVTSTGFGTVDTTLWPQFSQVVMLLLMTVGACAGSTGGGLKVSRIILLVKEAGKELHMLIHPNAVRTVRYEGKPVEKTVIRSLFNYLILYILLFILSLVVISLDGFTFTTNFSAVLACLNNIGPGFGAVGTFGNYAGYSALSKLVLSFDMIAGRLELLPMLILFYPKTWRRHY
ncbi:MAG: TrkH family potassium uptake protein [Lachnospiraceae bacterium]|nr:TrkH family potassium uptake protein [Lachnospiraceae bacterium]